MSILKGKNLGEKSVLTVISIAREWMHLTENKCDINICPLLIVAVELLFRKVFNPGPADPGYTLPLQIV